MKRRSPFLIAVLALLVVPVAGSLWFLKIKAPEILREKLVTAVERSCDGCHFEIGDVGISWLSLGQITLSDIHFESGVPGGLELDVSVGQLNADVVLREFSESAIHLTSLHLEDVRVLYTDGDAPSPPSPKKGADEPFFLTVDKSTLKSGRLTYVRNTHGTHAKILIHDISLDIGSVSNTEELRNEIVDVALLAQIEKSGTIDLKIKTKPFAKELFIDVDFRVRDQNLGDLTPFLLANTGVELEGILKNGRSRIKVRGQQETARVWAEYHGLKVKLHRMYDRSGFEAILVTLGAELTMADENMERDTDDQQRSVTYDRKPGQSIVAFLLQGMKEAAIKVAQAK